MRQAWPFALAVALGCTPPAGGEPASSSSLPAASVAPPVSSALPSAPAALASASASATLPVPPVPPSRPLISVALAEELLFLDAASEVVDCRAPGAPPRDTVRCLLALRYGGDAAASELALALYDRTGSVAGVEKPHEMDGGWRGHIDIVPELPVGRHRRHLQWVERALREIDEFFGRLHEKGGASVAYRWQPLELRFFRSVGRTTPSAYASPWMLAYNVSGSLHSSPEAVRETLFHEVFHMNDRTLDHWSSRVLGSMFDEIMARCQVTAGRAAASTSCLRPYSPGSTMVRGGTYYAFTPGNGVWEYAAELAVRYYREQLARLDGQPTAAPFKCGPPENAQAWQALVSTFFGGIDLVPPCP